MTHPLKTGLIAAALMLAPPLAGCTPPAGIAQPQAKDVTRVLNKQPKHVIRIEGRVPDSLQVEFDAVYYTDTKDMACFNHPSARSVPGPNHLAEPIELSRKNGRYQATFTIDKYQPGPCNWTLAKINAVVGKTGEPAEEAEVVEQVIRTYYFYHDESDASGCSVNPRSGDHRRCPVEANSLSAPVIIPCKVQSYESFPSSLPSFYCPATSSTKSKFKRSHRIKPGQDRVQIDFYDLDEEADPTE